MVKHLYFSIITGFVFFLCSCASGLKKNIDFDSQSLTINKEQSSFENPSYFDGNTRNVRIDESYRSKPLIDSILNELDQGEESVILTQKQYSEINLDGISKSLKDTVFLTNMFVKTPKSGLVSSYEFDILKDDLLFYSIDNVGKNKVESVSILEGDTKRFIQQDIAKGAHFEGSIQMESDNTLTLNISNNSFLANKGIFGSQLKIQLKKLSKKRINTEVIQDSIRQETAVIEKSQDTIYTIAFQKKITLNPKLDITKTHNASLPIDFSSIKGDIIGWGYWIGLQPNDSLDLSNAKDNVLVNYAKQELISNNGSLRLPTSTNDNLKFIINNQSLDARTVVYDENYAFYRSDKTIEKSPKKGNVSLNNLSDIYLFPININFIVVSTIPKESERIIESFIPVKYYKLSYSPQ